MSFAESLKRSRAGDRTAQEELFGRWRPLLRLQVRRLLGPELSARVDSSDVVQESLLQATQDLPQFRGTTQGEWVAWLRCLVTGHAAKAQRYHQAERRAVGREVAGPPNELAATVPSPVQQLIDSEQAARLAAAIEELPETLRHVLIRRFLDRQPLAEIATQLGQSPRAVRSLLSQALRRLAQVLS